MKNNQRKRYRKGTLVHIADLKVIKNNFATWLPCQVFKVTADEKSQDKRYVWVDWKTMGIDPKYVTLTTRKQREEYYAEMRNALIVGSPKGNVGRININRRKKWDKFKYRNPFYT